jgi:hypothetical protein
MTRRWQEWILIFAAAFAIFWSILRASVQSITIDEADTYNFFLSRTIRFVWWPSPNNHVLNTILMWITTHLLGTWNITMRAPALFGAVIYISVCYFLCRSLAGGFVLSLALFLCLVYNPFVFDYLVAARGYSLAMAFLFFAIAIPVFRHVHGRPSLLRCCVWASIAIGLSFSANFSFAFVDLVTILVIAAWALRNREGRSIVKILEACALPGLFLALLICGYPLVHWKAGDLFWGSHSLQEMFQTLVEPSFYRLDPSLAGTGLSAAMNFLKPLFPSVIGVLSAALIITTRLDGSWLQDAETRWLGRLAASLALIALASALVHWLAFHFFQLLLPRGRTGLYLVVLATLIAGIVAAVPPKSSVSNWLRRCLTASFVVLACYFLLCLRLTYFEEWRWDADMNDVYQVLARYNHTYGVTAVEADWQYRSALNYYLLVSKKETIPPFASMKPLTAEGKSLFVLHRVLDRPFLEKEKLIVVYQGKSTDVVIAVKPDSHIPPLP